VFSCKYGGARERGRNQIVRQLGLRMGEVRSAEASIKQKLDRFVTIMAAGRLCAFRAPTVAALATGDLSEHAERVARMHLESCPACRLEHAARLRALRSGRLPRDIAQLLPIPPTADKIRAPRVIWDTFTDWASRVLPHESTITGTQISLAGRGLGTLAASKLAALCIGGITIVGGALYCIETPLRGRRSHPERHSTAQRPKPTPSPSPSPVATATFVRAKATTTAAPTPKPRRKPQAERRKTPTTHEHDQALSPASPGAAPGGASEFGPSSATSSTPPAKPVTSGGPEFP
jgi:hypothetical protein